jgi:D-sedoheptulose 7-phosphate isomerase
MDEDGHRGGTAILQEAVASFQGVVLVAPLVDQASDIIASALERGSKVIFCGNGGSAADAQHLAAEFLGRYMRERAPLPSIALTSNSSAVTAIGNDYGFDNVFSRQLRGLARGGDVLVGISTSGNSRNVVEAFVAAKSLGVSVIALTGAAESAMSRLANVAIRVPSQSTPRIQEMHIAIGHTLCEIVETRMAGQTS